MKAAVMPFANAIRQDRAGAGLRNHLAGLAAEAAVERAYQARGLAVAARRWRGLSGEIDLILRAGRGFVFVEVKRGKHHAGAAGRLGRRQIGRLMAAAEEYCDLFGQGSLAEMRFDLATVDELGRVAISEAAFWAEDTAFAA